MKRRIVSLVPSLTETLCNMGFRDELVACTKFCVEPKGLARQLSLVGGTKDFDVSRIAELHPTHIIANQEENSKQPILELSEQFQTLITFPRSPLEVPSMLKDIAVFLDAPSSADYWVAEIEDLLLQFNRKDSKKYIFLIWKNPYMQVSLDTYAAQLLFSLGWQPAIAGDSRYSVIGIEEMKESQADFILMGSEPYPFRKRDANSLREHWNEAPPIYKVDGRLMTWFGTRTADALRYLLNCTHIRSMEDIFSPL